MSVQNLNYSNSFGNDEGHREEMSSRVISFKLFERLVFQVKASKVSILIIFVFFVCWIPNEISASISMLQNWVPSLKSTVLFFSSYRKTAICSLLAAYMSIFADTRRSKLTYGLEILKNNF